MSEITLDEFRAYIRELVDREIRPRAREADRTGDFGIIRENIKTLAQNDLLGVSAPAEFGGMGLGTPYYAVLIEELTRACPSTGVSVAVHSGIVINFINQFGSKEQKEKYLPRLIKGELLGAFSITEPGAGSDAGSIRTLARETEDGWVLSGSKIFTTNGRVADLIIVMAVSDPDKGKRGISAFLVEKGTPGLNPVKDEEKMGWHATPTTQLSLDDLRLPGDALIGERGAGFKYAMISLDSGRVGIAAMGVGIIAEALSLASRYALEREQFGRPIADFQAIQWMLADMAVDLEAARLLTLRAAELKDRGVRYTKEAAIAKLFATEAAVRATQNCIQVFGGYGYTEEYEPARLFRDARALTLVEGTSEIQRLVIAREILRPLRRA